MRCPARTGMYNRKPCLSMSAPWLHKSVPFDFTSVQKKKKTGTRWNSWMWIEEELNRLTGGGAHLKNPAFFVSETHPWCALKAHHYSLTNDSLVCNNPLNSWTLAPVDSTDRS